MPPGAEDDHRDQQRKAADAEHLLELQDGLLGATPKVLRESRRQLALEPIARLRPREMDSNRDWQLGGKLARPSDDVVLRRPGEIAVWERQWIERIEQLTRSLHADFDRPGQEPRRSLPPTCVAGAAATLTRDGQHSLVGAPTK
jgi:hypothetical protein